MIYIALTYLVGILWIHHKILATLLLLLVILSMFRKRIRWFIIILTLIPALLSFIFFDFQLKQTMQKHFSIMQQPNINQYAKFQNIFYINNRKLSGSIVINKDIYRFIYYTDMPIKLDYVKNHSCHVNGVFKSLSPSVKRPLFVTLKHINQNSCTPQQISLANIFSQHKQYLYYKIQHSGLQQYDKIIALLFGDISLLPKQLLEKVKDIGIYHLLAVSGSHIIAIVGMVYFSCLRIGIPIPYIKIILCIILPIYACYTDFAPSALRAIIMVITVMILPRFMLYRAIDILGIAFIIISLIKPQYIYDIGFQFSFLITLFILLSAPLLAQYNKIMALIYLNIITYLGSFMISSIHFNEIQWVGLFSNLIFIPLYSFIYFPIAIFYLFYAHIPITFKLITNLIDSLFLIHDEIVAFFLNMAKFHWFIPELSEIEVSIFFVTIFIILRFVVLNKLKQATMLFMVFAVTITFLTKDHNVQLLCSTLVMETHFYLKQQKIILL